MGAEAPYRHGSLATKSELKTAEQILDRFYRDAEGKTNRQIDVYFALQDMDIPRDKAEPSIEYLVSRGLINTFGPDVAFLTDRGVQVMTDDIDIGTLDKVLKDFIQKPVDPVPVPDAPESRNSGKASTVRPASPSLTHIDLDGQEFTLELAWVCTIGRADSNQVCVNDQRASKMHAEIRYENETYVLHDLESANGTLLNGNYVVEPETLKHDDEIVIGRTMLLFTAPLTFGPPAEAAPSKAPEEAATIVPPGAPTERPAEAEDHAPIRVVRGRPAPTPTPAPRPTSGSDLFAEPSIDDASGSLFSSPPEAGAQDSGPRPPSDDLFGDAPTAAASDDDLFGSPTPREADDLFAGEETVATQDSDDLFAEPKTEAPDLFGDAAPEAELQTLDESALEEIEPIAMPPSAQIVEPDGDWNDDTPKSEPGGLLENQPVHERASSGTGTNEDANTVMVDRESIFGNEGEENEDPPRWGDEPAAMGSHPDFAAEAERAGTLPPDGESMPVATPSLANIEPPSSRMIEEARPDGLPTMDVEPPGDTAFHEILAELRRQAERADLPDKGELIDAIDLLDRHPYIRVVLQKIGS